MSAQPTRHRPRLFASLGLAVSSMLSPSGKIISSAVAATALIGGLVTQLPPAVPSANQVSAPASVAPTHLAHGASSAPVLTHIEIDGQTLPVSTEGPAGGSTSVAGGLPTASSAGPSGGGGQMQKPGSPQVGPQHTAALPSHRTPVSSPQLGDIPMKTGPGASAPQNVPRSGAAPASVAAPDDGSPLASLPAARPGPAPFAGSSKPAGFGEPGEGSAPLRGEPQNEPLKSSPARLAEPSGQAAPPGPAHVSGPNVSTGPYHPNESGAPTSPPQHEPRNEPLKSSPVELPVPSGQTAPAGPAHVSGPNDPTGPNHPNELGAPMPPPQQGPHMEPPEPLLGNMPDPFDTPELQLPTGMDDPLNPHIPASTQPEPLLAARDAGADSPSAENFGPTAVPEPSMVVLMLLGAAALAWTGRRRPARHI